MAQNANQLQQGVLGVVKLFFALIVLLLGITIASDAWNLIAPGAILERWTVLGCALGLNGIMYYGTRSRRSVNFYKAVLYAEIALGISLATFLVYTERGIASKSVILYALPIISAAALARRSALYATAVVAIASYAVTTLRYQFLHPGESYKVELYAAILLYSGLLFIVAVLVSRVLYLQRNS